MGLATREMMAKRAAQEINHGDIVNLGFGIPQKILNYIPADKIVFFHAENGILGAGKAAEKGKEDPNITDSGCVPVGVIEGASYFDAADSFGMVRAGVLDSTFLGALEVAENGDLANWMIPGGKGPGMGGAMELAQKAKRVIILMKHVDKHGKSKLKKRCEYPLTASKCVSLIITDRAVIKRDEQGLILTEVFEGNSIEDIVRMTDATLRVADHVKVIPLVEGEEK